jgi:hypothetical protein
VSAKKKAEEEEEEEDKEETMRITVQYSTDYMLRIYAKLQGLTTVKLTSALFWVNKNEDVNFTVVPACNNAYILNM